VFPQLADAADKYFDIRLTAREVVYGDIQMHSLAVSLDKSGNFVISAERLLGLPVFQQGVQLDGELQLLELGNDIAEATGRVRYQGVESKWHIRSGEQESSLCLEADTRLLHRLTEFEAIQEPLSWVKKGRLETCARYLQTTAVQDQIDLSLALKGLAFDSPDGRYAAEALEIGLEAEWLLMEPPVIEAEVRVEAGEVLLDNLYVNFSAAPLTSMLRPHWRDGELSGVGISASDDGAMKLMAELSIAGSDAWALDIKRLELAFPAAYGRYIEPLAALWTLDGLAVSGSMVWEGSLGPDKFRSGDLEIVDLSVVDTQLNRFALTGLETRLRPGNYDVSSELSWRGLLLGKINLGAGSALLDSEPGAFALLEPLELHVLGGKMHLERLHYRLPGTLLEGQSVSRFEIEARLTELDMAQLTTALGWPQFSGSLSGEVPGAMLSDGVLSVDGEVRVDVFDGAVIIRDLEVERLFGVLPSLSANIDMVGLELTQLTETFEFGRIGGKIDGYVHDLRMLDWRPVAFNAWMGTPESQSKSKAISRQAVNHLTTIGGGGATTALTSPMLRMFNNFSYRRLGLGCRLQNNACEITGVSEDGNSVLLMEGAGIPRITVRAWNRRVDWPQMVANLATISSGESIQVGDTPEP
jgi:hypothetical protein